jgi:hypothetical protein
MGVVDEVSIAFPKQYRNFAPKTFAYELGDSIECGVYLTRKFDRSEFLNYKGLLNLMKGTRTE